MIYAYSGTPTPRGTPKTSTGLVGLDVQPHAREILIELYTRTAAELAKIPESYHLRKDIENTIRHRLSILLEETDVLRLEEEIDEGQLETLIANAKEELYSEIPRLLELKPWAKTSTNKWENQTHLYTDFKHL